MAERFGKILMRLMYFRVKRRNLKEFVFWTATSGVPVTLTLHVVVANFIPIHPTIFLATSSQHSAN